MVQTLSTLAEMECSFAKWERTHSIFESGVIDSWAFPLSCIAFFIDCYGIQRCTEMEMVAVQANQNSNSAAFSS